MNGQTSQESVQKLRELIKDIDFAMLTTIDSDGSLRSRPMTTQQTEFDGDLWFFTPEPSGKTDEIAREQQVNVSYALPDKHRYVSVSGRARLVNDRAKMKELWSPAYKVFFPGGLDDPSLRLLKVEVDKAEYWDSKGTVATVIGFARALTGGEADLGENQKLTL